MGGIIMFIRVVASRRASCSTECLNKTESMDLQQVPMVIPMMNIATAQGMGSFLQISLTSPPTPRVVTMKNMPSDTIEGSFINFNKMSFEVLLLDDKYQKVGDNPESQNKWKILNADECETIPQLVQAKSTIIVGSSSLNPGNSGQVLRGDNLFQKSSHHLAYSKSASTFYIISGSTLIVYQEAELKKLLSASETFNARPTKIIKFTQIPNNNPLCHVSISPSELYLVVATNTHISFLNVGDEVEQPFLPIMSGNIFWEGPDSFVIQSSEQLAFQGYSISQGSLQKHVTTFPKIIQEGDTFHLFDKGQRIQLDVKFSIFSCLYRCSDGQNFIICGHQQSDNDFGFDSDEETKPEYTAIIQFFRYSNNKVEFQELSFDVELKFPNSCAGDFNIQEIVNNKVENGQVKPASLITICGSNLPTIKVAELFQGKISAVLRMMNSDELSIYTNSQIKGCVPVSFISTINEQIIGLALNGEYFLTKRIPVLLVLNEKKNLLQYQLVDLQKDKLQALTKDFTKVSSLLCEKVKTQPSPPSKQELPQTTQILTQSQPQKGLFDSIQPLTQTPVTSESGPQLNNQFVTDPTWPNDQYVVVEMSKLGLESLCKPPFNLQVITTGEDVGNIHLKNGQVKDPHDLRQEDVPSANTMAYSSELQSVLIGFRQNLYTYNAMGVFQNLLGSSLMPKDRIQVFKDNEDPIQHVIVWNQLYIVASKSQLKAYHNVQDKCKTVAWQIQRKNIKKIEKSFDENYLLIQDDNTYSLHQQKLDSDGLLQQKVAIDAVCFYNEGLLYQTGSQLFYILLDGSPTQFNQESPLKKISYMHQLSNKTVYMSYFNKGSLKITFQELIVQVDTQDLRIQPLDIPFSKDITLQDDYEFTQVDWNVQRIALRYEEEDKLLKVGYLAVVCCNFNADYYVFSCYGNNLSLIETEPDTYQYIPSYNRILRGMTLLGCQSVDEKKLLVYHGGKKCEAIMLPQLFYYGIDENNKTLGFYRSGIFNVNTQEIMRDKSKSKSILDKMGVKREPKLSSVEQTQTQPQTQPQAQPVGAIEAPQSNPFLQNPKAQTNPLQIGFSSAPDNNSQQFGLFSNQQGPTQLSQFDVPKTQGGLFSNMGNNQIFTKNTDLFSVQSQAQPQQLNQNPIQPVQTPTQPIQTPVQPIQTSTQSLFQPVPQQQLKLQPISTPAPEPIQTPNPNQTNVTQPQQAPIQIINPQPVAQKVQPAYVLDPTGLKLQQMSEVINKSDFLKLPPINWKEVLPKLEAQRKQLQTIFDTMQKYSVQIWKSNPEQIINARQQHEKLQQYIRVLISSNGENVLRDKLIQKITKLGNLIEDLYTRNDFAMEFYETFQSYMPEDQNWKYSSTQRDMVSLFNQGQKRNTSMLADFSGVKFQSEQESRIDSTLFAPRRTNIACRNVDFIQLRISELKQQQNVQSTSQSKKGRMSFQEFLNNEKSPGMNQNRNKNKVLWDNLNQVGNHPSVVYHQLERFVPQKKIEKVQPLSTVDYTQKVPAPKFQSQIVNIPPQTLEKQKPIINPQIQDQSKNYGEDVFDQPQPRKMGVVPSKDLGDLLSQDQSTPKQNQTTPSFRRLGPVSSYLNIPQAIDEKQKQNDEEAKNLSTDQKLQQTPIQTQQPIRTTQPPKPTDTLQTNTSAQSLFGGFQNLSVKTEESKTETKPDEAKKADPNQPKQNPFELKPAEPKPVEPKVADPKTTEIKPPEPKPEEKKTEEPKVTPSFFGQQAPEQRSENLQTPPQVRPSSIPPGEKDPKQPKVAEALPSFSGTSLFASVINTSEAQNPPSLTPPQGGFLAFSQAPSALQPTNNGGGLFSGGGFGASTFGQPTPKPTMGVAPSQIQQLQFGSSANPPAPQNQGSGGIFGNFTSSQNSVGFGNIQVQQSSFLNQIQGGAANSNFMKPRK